MLRINRIKDKKIPLFFLCTKTKLTIISKSHQTIFFSKVTILQTTRNGKMDFLRKKGHTRRARDPEAENAPFYVEV